MVKPDDLEGPLQFFAFMYAKQQPIYIVFMRVRPRAVELNIGDPAATEQNLSQVSSVFDLPTTWATTARNEKCPPNLMERTCVCCRSCLSQAACR